MYVNTNILVFLKKSQIISKTNHPARWAFMEVCILFVIRQMNNVKLCKGRTQFTSPQTEDRIPAFIFSKSLQHASLNYGFVLMNTLVDLLHTSPQPPILAGPIRKGFCLINLQIVDILMNRHMLTERYKTMQICRVDYSGHRCKLIIRTSVLQQLSLH